jgi:hypothetical protein
MSTLSVTYLIFMEDTKVWKIYFTIIRSSNKDFMYSKNFPHVLRPSKQLKKKSEGL